MKDDRETPKVKDHLSAVLRLPFVLSNPRAVTDSLSSYPPPNEHLIIEFPLYQGTVSVSLPFLPSFSGFGRGAVAPLTHTGQSALACTVVIVFAID